MIIFYEPYLAHHGVKGMKWGVRRIRNKVQGIKGDTKKLGKNFGKKFLPTVGRSIKRASREYVGKTAKDMDKQNLITSLFKNFGKTAMPTIGRGFKEAGRNFTSESLDTYGGMSIKELHDKKQSNS